MSGSPSSAMNTWSAPTGGTWIAWLLIVAAGVLLALFFGAAVTVLPPLLIVAAGCLLMLLPVYVLRPAWLIVPAIAFAMYFPWQPVADVVTVLFLARAGVALVRRWPELRAALSDPLLRPLYVLAACAVVSFVTAVTVLEHGKSPVYQDGRVYVYWLWIIAFAAWAPRVRPERWVARQLLMVATLVSALAVIQGALGIILVRTGNVSALESAGYYSEITRVQIPGFVFVTFGVFYCVAQMVSTRNKAWLRWAYMALLGLFTLAVIYNFGRAIWFWSFLGACITALAMGWRASTRLLIWGGLLATAIGATIVWTYPRLAETIVERVVSVLDEGGTRTSYGWREAENRAAREVLADSVLLGTGLGGEYRAPVVGLRSLVFENHTRYIHNGHLSVMLKLSVFGYLAYAALFVMMFLRARRARADPALGPICAAIMAWLITFVGQNITQPDIMSAAGLTLLAALFATLVLMRLRGAESETDATPASLEYRPGRLRNALAAVGARPRVAGGE